MKAASLYYNWGAFGTLQVRLLIRYQAAVVFAANAFESLKNFIF
jgi:hypothetical protein